MCINYFFCKKLETNLTLKYIRKLKLKIILINKVLNKKWQKTEDFFG